MGTPKLLAFACRAIALILLISILWPGIVSLYNDALVLLARPLTPDGVTLLVSGSHILFSDPRAGSFLSLDALTLHFGLILMTALILAVVGMGFAERARWLAAMAAATFAGHVVCVVAIAMAFTWAARADPTGDFLRLAVSAFAVFWGLIPALIGGLWCYLQWDTSVSATPGRLREGSRSRHGT